MILDFLDEDNSEGLDIGIDISLTQDQPNQNINRFSPRINEEQSQLLLGESGESHLTRPYSGAFQSKDNAVKL